MNNKIYFITLIFVAINTNAQGLKSINDEKNSIKENQESLAKELFAKAEDFLDTNMKDSALHYLNMGNKISTSKLSVESLYNNLAGKYNKLGDSEKTIKNSRLAYAQNKNEIYLLIISNQYKQDKKYDKCIVLCDSIINQNGYPVVYHNRGHCKLAKGEIDGANTDFKTFVEKFNNNKISNYYIARSFAEFNQPNNSLDYIKKAFESGFDNFDSLAKDKIFDTIRDTKEYQKLMKKHNPNFEKEEKYASENKEFLNKNSKRSEIKILASGLQYEIIKEANGTKPGPLSNVKVHYIGTLIDGTVFDSSIKRGQSVDLVVNTVMKGWIEGLQLMSVGSTYKFYIPSELAFGSSYMPNVPANSTLIMEIQLLDILE